MKLLIDAGNRRLKWAVTRGGDAPDGARGVLDTDAIAARGDALAAQWAAIERPASVWVSCVAGARARHAIEACARRAWGLQAVFIASRARQAGIVNAYRQPTALGSDRWAALVAARRLFARRPVIVVDAGTAVTVDALDGGGVFRGGVIFPGARGMRAALRESTENIAGHNGDGKRGHGGEDPAGAPDPIATDTRSAVMSGAWLAVAGGIDLAVARQRATLPGDCRVLATGGDAERIAPLLTSGVEITPDLVLRGLAVIAAESAS